MAKIVGNTTVMPNPQPDWAQTDSTKADFIKSKPRIASTDVAGFVKSSEDTSNTIKVDNDGIMTVNSVTQDKVEGLDNRFTEIDNKLNKNLLDANEYTQEKFDELQNYIAELEMLLFGQKVTFGLNYEISDDRAYAVCTGIGTATSPNIIVAPIYSNLPVLAIDNEAFMNNTEITSLTLPEGITMLGDAAFKGCTNLTTINLPSTLETLGTDCFRGCTGLVDVITNSIKIGDSGSHVFAECTSLENGQVVSIFDSTVPNYAFYGCTKLNNLRFSDNLDNITEYAFYGCSSLKTLELTGSTLGQYAFAYCTNLTDITRNENCTITTIPQYAFTYCENLVNLDFMGLTHIEVGAFSYCSFENGLTIPNTVEEIGGASFRNNKATIITANCQIVGYSAFNTSSNAVAAYLNCKEINKNILDWSNKLTTVYMTKPYDDLSIHPQAFNYSNKITDVYVSWSEGEVLKAPWDETNPTFAVHYNCDPTIYGVKYTNHGTYYSCDGLLDISKTSIVIADEIDGIPVTTVPANAFENCMNLESVTIPSNVTAIEANAFKGCSNLTIHTDFTNKPDGWDENWNPDDCEVVWYEPPSVETWDISATESDNVVAKLYADAENEGMYSLKINGAGNMKNYTSSEKAPWYDNYRKSINSVTIGNSVTSIGNDAFSGCSSLTSVTIPDSVTYIGERAFSDCSSLTSVTIPDSVTSIGNDAFAYCSSLETITIPTSVTTVGSNAFKGCNNLTIYSDFESKPDGWDASWNPDNCEVVWYVLTPVETWDISATEGDNVIAKLYTDEANKGMYSLKISGNGNMKNYSNAFDCPWFGSSYGEKINSITIHDGVTSIGRCAFYRCTKCTSVTIPNSVTKIGNSAFYNCSSLASITIPDSVTTIDDSAFHSCSSFTSITIPDGVTTIGGYAFAYCPSLTSITIPDSVTSIGWGAFYKSSLLESITFEGTIAQWNTITFDTNWNQDILATYVQCSDGQVKL